MRYLLMSRVQCLLCVGLVTICYQTCAVVCARVKRQTSLDLRIHPGDYTFDELVTKGLFVDKTMMIKEFITSKCKITVVTRPQRWGKSVNLQMIKRFYEAEVNEEGIYIKISKRKNHKLFEGGEVELPDGLTTILAPLKISAYKDIMKHLGQSPVLVIRLSLVKGKNYKAIEDKLKRELRNTYLDHKYLKEYLSKENLMLNSSEKAQLERYFSNKQLTEKELENGLFHLCKLLYDHFRQKVIILIDEKDAPLNNAIEIFGEKEEEIKKVMQLLQGFFKGVVNNKFMKKCLITGTLPFTEDDLFLNATKVCVRSVLDEGYFDYFGFSETEVDGLLSKHLPNGTAIDKMKYWYGGFQVCNNTLYNPLDVIGYISNQGRLLDYWADRCRVKHLDTFLTTDEAQTDLQSLLEDEEIVKSLCKHDNPKEDERFHIFYGIFFRLMVHQGYLNAFKYETGNEYVLRIPNQEIRNLLVELKTQWFCSKHEIFLSDLLDFIGSLVTKQFDMMKESLSRVFENVKHFALQEEKDYQIVMGNVFNRLLNHNIVITNPLGEQNSYALYHLIIPRSKFQGHVAFVFEYAVLDPKHIGSTPVTRQLQVLAQETLENINSHVYGPVIANYEYVDAVVTVAVAFSGLQLELSYKMFKQ